MDQVLVVLGSLFDFIETLFARTHVLSLLIGQGVGMGLTQCVKYPLAWRLLHSPVGTPQRVLQEQQLRWGVRIFAVLSTAIATYFTWPNGNALWIALAAGGCSPMLYLLIIKVVGRFAPWLSATKLPDDPPVL